MKLHYQPPRRREIIPEPFRRLAQKRSPARALIAAGLILVLIGLILWIWWGHRESAPQPKAALTNTTAEPAPTPAPLPTTPQTPEMAAKAPEPAAPLRPAPAEADPDSDIKLQIALARAGFSPGPIDGISGGQTRSALRAFQKAQNLRPTAVLDEATHARLFTGEPFYGLYTVTSADLLRLRSLGRTWLAKSRQDRLDYETVLELVAELSRSDEDLLWRLNPDVNWSKIQAGTLLKVPNVQNVSATKRAAAVRIFLRDRVLQIFDENNAIIAHFPCSIGQRVDKRPVGMLSVATIAPNPNYTFDPAIFSESPEAQQLGRKLILQPGPNNPVGSVWIGLDRPGYGIHGTPQPEKVGRTESHGCFRLANWNAEFLLKLAWIGMPVYVEP